MSNQKRGLRLLGLPLLSILGLMAFMAVGAQAEWLILLADETVHVLKAGENESVKISAHTASKVLIPAKNLEIVCDTLEGEELKLIGGGSLAEGKVKLTKCKTYTIGPPLTEQPKCKPAEPIVLGIVAHLVLHEVGGVKKNYILFLPPAGSETFTTIKFPETCALISTSKLTGEVLAECGELVEDVFTQVDCDGRAITQVECGGEEHQVAPLLRAAESQELVTKPLKVGANPAFLDGEALVELSGKYKGLAWGGHI
jgi:hypothetical protein